jgi:hypothetical protein
MGTKEMTKENPFQLKEMSVQKLTNFSLIYHHVDFSYLGRWHIRAKYYTNFVSKSRK